MEQDNYHSSITVAATPETVFACIADVSLWWTKSFNGRSQNTGDTFTVQFGDTKVAFKTVASEPAKRVIWEVTDCYLHWLNNKTEWNNTQIVWDISAKEEATQIDMTHVGLVPGIECYENCNAGWNQYIKGSLYKLLTEGKGQPD